MTLNSMIARSLALPIVSFVFTNHTFTQTFPITGKIAVHNEYVYPYTNTGTPIRCTFPSASDAFPNLKYTKCKHNI
ncbi:hypothetical protein LL912_05095 [Niabella sp. CC-SYL272]|uniref:hypothetical protein n=1 Tax=Niabella agricola TaxID=2891571 RepID=UPI001F1A1002|nr:hypothetical protein [Niabella agricola]MCF3108145.1 hypothetical protein [Niabella agricola]